MKIASLDRVIAVANAIFESGREPTYKAVRTILGGGSYSTIRDGLKAWKSSRIAAGKPIVQPSAFKKELGNPEAEKHGEIDKAAQLTVELEAAQHKVAYAEAIGKAAFDLFLELETAMLAKHLATAEVHSARAHRHDEQLNAELARVNKHNLELIQALQKSYRLLLGAQNEIH